MIEKNLTSGINGIRSLMEGVDTLADAVTSTLGAAGRTVIIEDQYGNPHVTKDGVTVANSIILSDPVENLGAMILKQASQKTANEAGDGTTTSCALAQEMVHRIYSKYEEIVNVHEVKKGMDAAASDVLDILEKQKIPVDDDKLFQVATISANGDKYIGEMISDAYQKVGKSGIVTMDDSLTGSDYIHVTKGTRIKKGYGTPFSINNARNSSVEYNNPLIVMSDFKIDMHERLHFAFEASIKQKRPLLIISDLDDRVKLFITQNVNKKNLTANFITPEGIGINRFELLQDLALMTGGKVMSEMAGDSIQNIDGSYLGTCKQMISDINETILIFEEEENPERDDTIKWLEDKIKTAAKHERYHYEDRLSKLSGGVATINLSANSEVELREKKDRVDDSIHATKAALEEGIVAGGGAVLNYAYKKLAGKIQKSRLKPFSDDYVIGYNIVVNSLRAPFFCMLDNAGITDNLFDKVNSNKNPRYGYNVITRKTGDMITMGIVDPVKVTKNAILNSKSVAATLLTTSCVISNKRASNESSR